jgi:aldose 1-epimerase
MVFTGDTLGSAERRRSVAIEPMTCPPNAFVSGKSLVRLEAGASWKGSWGVSVR